MKFEIQQGEMMGYINNALPFVTKNAILPVLECVVIFISGKSIKMAATDLSSSIEFTANSINMIKSDSKMKAVCIPLEKLKKIVHSFESNKVLKFDAKDKSIQISCGRSKSKLPIIDYKTFPKYRENDADLRKVAIMPFTRFKTILQNIHPSSLKDESRPQMSGVYLSHNKKQKCLEFIATDGAMMSRARVYQEQDETFNLKFIPKDGALISAASIRQILRVNLDNSENSTIEFNERIYKVTSGDIQIRTRLVDMRFPNCQPIIEAAQNSTNKSLDCDKNMLHQIIKRLSISIDDGRNIIDLALENDAMYLYGASANYSEEAAEIVTDSEQTPYMYLGEHLNLSLHYNSFESILNRIDSNEVNIKFAAFNKAVIFTAGDDTEGKKWLHLLQPFAGNLEKEAMKEKVLKLVG